MQAPSMCPVPGRRLRRAGATANPRHYVALFPSPVPSKRFQCLVGASFVTVRISKLDDAAWKAEALLKPLRRSPYSPRRIRHPKVTNILPISLVVFRAVAIPPSLGSIIQTNESLG